MSMTTPLAPGSLVTVFGGSGFIGRYVVRALVKRGYRVRAAVRRPDLAGHLQPMGSVGQVHAVQANVRFPESVAKAIEGASGVVNLVGLLDETGSQKFDSVQAKGAETVAKAAADAGVTTFVQMSAIGADEGSGAQYATSKARGEHAVLQAMPSAVVLRPSIVFGPEDEFFNRFASMARLSPALPAVGGGKTLFQPVYVGDVAEATAAVFNGHAKAGATYELGGPEVLSFRDLLERVLEYTGRKRAIVSLPFWLARIQAFLVSPLPGRPITADQITMLESDNVVSETAKADGHTLDALGITNPQAIESVVPDYLVRFNEKGQYATYRG